MARAIDSNTSIAVVSAGEMGSGIGRVLVEHGLKVSTSLDGRSAATIERVRSAGMTGVTDDDIAQCDLILSIVPPSDALATAQRFARAVAAAESCPVYADCNAVSPASVQVIAHAFDGTGALFVDGGIIGAPPSQVANPRIYVSGEHADVVAQLSAFGLDVNTLDGPVGAASAMKLSYAGITKGITALGAAMVLAAQRAGTTQWLLEELAFSQPGLLQRFALTFDDAYPKAYRFVGEMEELADYTGEDPGARQIFEGAATLYGRLADDQAGDQREVDVLKKFAEAARAILKAP